MMGNTILRYLSSKKYRSILYNKKFAKKAIKQELFYSQRPNKQKKFLKTKKIINNYKIDLIINCSGITKHKNLNQQKKYANKINNLLNHELSKINKVKLVILSTDCVFDGKDGNYVEKSNRFSNSLYGKSKKAGEIISKKNVLTFRSSGLGHEIFSKRGLRMVSKY